MNNFFVFDEDDKKLWLGLAASGIFFVVAFSLFGGDFFKQIERVVFFLLEDITPGFVIMKLYLDKLSLSDYKIVDKIMVSFAISITVMEIPFYLLKYLRPYEDNTDEKAWGAINDTAITLILLLLVLGIAFGVKYYQNKKKGIA
jgi:hypothetical protein